MTPFTTLTARACPLPLQGVDTDQIVPARFMGRTRAEGYGSVLLHDLRFDPSGAEVPGFPLNERPGCAILVARRNLGGGSSREAAVYALLDYGIRCVLAPSFGDIFAANAANNGLLPARVQEDDAERLLAALSGGLQDLTVDLHECQVHAGQDTLPFTVDPVFRTKLLNGWDDLDLTASHAGAIAAFAQSYAAARPWAAPRHP